MMEIFFIYLAAAFVAIASGLIGSLLILKRMTLIADALAHIALPGIALGVIFHFEPLLGGLIFLLVAVILIWQIENKTKLAFESITGVLFTTALAVGTLLIPETEILETFFGSLEKITLEESLILLSLALIISILYLYFLKPLILISIAPDLSIASKIPYLKIKLLLLFLVALTIAIGIKFVGILLISALSIIPAATARNLAKNFKTFLCLSVIIALISLLSALIFNQFKEINPGIITVIVSAVLFFLSLFFKRKRKN